ncbi:TetR/AcrR family transcriptional regulator [Phenylobacterium aquaticum]|uniref:TetR/AcrR family transcriptional regulator n=1 Tax=Phenylobacterium aquaticum TaxID=1763816 RepID=UPI0026F01B01|nr:TetR/AcrR family transcriptional regulator [Phenylobacterium aquaticum]
MTEVKAPRRRRATQTRSKATVQRILDAATDLIVERGAQGVTMSEIAKRADLVIGSLYQYFADRSAICRAILIRHQAEARTLLHHYVAGVQTLEALTEALSLSFDAYFELLQKDRLIIGLWAIVQTDPELQALDLEDSLQNARYLAGVAAPMLPGVDLNRLVATCVMLIQFSLYAGRLARDVPDPIAGEIPATYKAMFLDSLASLQRPRQT